MSVSSDTSGLDLPQLSDGGQVTAGQYGGTGSAVPNLPGNVPTMQPPALSPAHIDHHSSQITQDDHTDELDKEWISKAKLIVEQTKNDPFTQSKEVGRVKADYLRIRFNKHIKLGSDQTL